MARTNKPNTEENVHASDSDRDAIKAELDALEVEYSSRAHTHILEKLLADTKAGVVQEDLAPLSGAAPETTPEPAVTAPVVASHAAQVVIPKTTGTVLIANQHQGGVTLPRRGEAGIVAKPLRFAPGTVTQVDAAEWAKYKRMSIVQAYREHGIIAEVHREGPVHALSEKTSDLIVPEHLQTDAEQVQDAMTSAGLVKANAGTIQV